MIEISAMDWSTNYSPLAPFTLFVFSLNIDASIWSVCSDLPVILRMKVVLLFDEASLFMRLTIVVSSFNIFVFELTLLPLT